MIPKFWCSPEVTAAGLHLGFVIKRSLWWKRTFLPVVTIIVLHHKHTKLLKSFTQHVIAWSVRKGFNQSVRRTKEQKTRLQSWAFAGGGAKRAFPPGNETKISRKRKISSIIPISWVNSCNESLFADVTLTLHNSQFTVLVSCSH